MQKFCELLCDAQQRWKKTIRIMKLTTGFILFAIFTASAVNTYSQNTRLNLNLKDATIVDIFREIERNSEFGFFFKSEEMNLEKRQSVSASNATIDEVLRKVLDDNYSYKILDKNIVVTKGSLEATIQGSRVSGKVTDSSGVPIPGASVVVKGTTTGVTTDNDGNFSLTLPADAKTLVFSFLGMRTQEITIANKTLINLVMQEEAIGLDEIVTIGYGTIKKRDLTGSVGSISKKDIGDRTASSVGALIQGKVAGVDVSRDKIRVRGVTSLNNTDPLVVIDGFQGVSMSSINTNDVESIEVLKDASSTAIYGARGANGVILITTKNGKTGPLKVNINAFTGFGTTPKRYDMLNASQYIDYAKDALTNAKMKITDRLNSAEVRKDVTNWQNEIFQVSKASEINVDLSGGSENSSFFVSYGYKKNNEVYIGPSQDNSTIRIKNLFKIKKWFKAGDDVSLSYNLSRGATNSATSAGNIPFMTALPYIGVLDPTNYWGYTRANRYTDLSDSENPVGIINLTHPTGTTLNYSANLWIEMVPFKGLTYRVQAGVSGFNNRSTLWNNKFEDSANTTHPSNYSEGYAYNFSPIVESYLTYTKQFGKHDFSAMIGNTWQNYATSGGIGIYGETFANETVKNVFQAQTKMIKNQDNAQFAYLSYFGRLNYQYNNRYLLTVNARRDGSPRFAPSNRWATFPSVALAWKMHEESFIKDLNIFDQLKLRASWGISGNDAIGDFKYLSQVWTNGVYYPLGNVEAPVQGATVSAPSSQSIKWESTESKSVGVDMAFLKNALSITTEYFVKNTNDILFAVPRAVSLGYGLGNPASAIVNAASVVNKGFELQVGYKNNIGSLKYSVNTNYTHVTNSVTSLGLGQPYLSGISRTAKGESIGYLFGHVAEGVFMSKAQLDAANEGAKAAAKAKNPAITDLALSKIYYQYSSTAPGDVKFKDVNGDGMVTDADRTKIGNSIPQHIFGFNINLEYKGFDFNTYFQGVAGNDIYYGNFKFLRGMERAVNAESWVLNRWRSEAEPGNGIVPRAIIGDPNGNNRFSSLQVYSGNYIKLKQMSIGYTFSEKLISKLKLSNLRVYATGYNLLTFTKYPGFDPEFANANLSRGEEMNNYPVARTISFGIQVGL